MQTFFQQKPDGQNIKRLRLIKENQTSQVSELSTFLCMGDARIWAHLNHSLDMHLSYLELVFWFSILDPLRVHSWGCSSG